jgi:hypothetical protein
MGGLWHCFPSRARHLEVRASCPNVLREAKRSSAKAETKRKAKSSCIMRRIDGVTMVTITHQWPYHDRFSLGEGHQASSLRVLPLCSPYLTGHVMDGVHAHLADSAGVAFYQNIQARGVKHAGKRCDLLAMVCTVVQKFLSRVLLNS